MFEKLVGLTLSSFSMMISFALLAKLTTRAKHTIASDSVVGDVVVAALPLAVGHFEGLG
jgi:hypothetical protein